MKIISIVYFCFVFYFDYDKCVLKLIEGLICKILFSK